MANLYLTEHGLSLHKYGETLIIKKNGKKLFKIGLHNIDNIILAGNIQFSTQLLYKLFNHNISLSLLSSKGVLMGRLSPVSLKNVELRYKQFTLSSDLSFRLNLSKELIKAKFLNSIYLIEKYSKYRKNSKIKNSIDTLKSKTEHLREITNLNSVYGHEGNFARLYYGLYSDLFNNNGFFKGRSRRPPKDPANAVLSYLYTVITGRIASFIEAVGFDPYLGFFHTIDYGRPSLACDLIEPIRSILCDRIVLRAFNIKIFNENDFEKKKGGIYLKSNSINKFFRFYDSEMGKVRNYNILKGTFVDFLNYQAKWLRKSIESGKVSSLLN